MSYQVPNDAAFYLRGAIFRAFQKVRQDIEQSDKFLARFELDSTDPKYLDPTEEYNVMMRDQAKSIKWYNEQWIREAHTAFKTLPPQLMPTDID